MSATLELVIAWLEGGTAADYQAGVLLLQEHCRNRSLINHLLKKESPANREKLVYELLKLGTDGDLSAISEVQSLYAQAVQGAVPPPSVPPTAPPAQQVPPLAEQPAPEAEQVPEHLRAQVEDLTQLMQRLYKERCQLSNRLADGGPEEPELVGRILTLQQQYNALAERRRLLLAGQVPAEQPAPAAEGEPAPVAADEAAAPQPAPGVDRARLLQERANLRSNLSKTKGKLEKATTEAKRVELAEKVAKYEAELQQVELLLKTPDAA